MKKIILPMLTLAAGFAFTSCDDKLDIPQKAVLTTETFYSTDDDCEQALAAAYENFQVNTVGRTTLGPGIYTPARVLANHPGDDVNYGGEGYGDHEFGGSIDEFRFLHTPEAIEFHYKGIYLSVYKDNLVIDYFKEPKTDFQKQAVAEARVLRAYNYFLLACYWGTPPFVDHLLSGSDIPVNSDSEDAPEGAPKTQQEYFVWIAQQCEQAVADLSERKATTDKEGTYRVTKGFANALAGKAYMFAGEFAKAKDCLKKVIDSGKYALVSGDDFMDLFHIQGDGAPEKVFEVNVRYNSSAGEWSTGSGMGWNNHSTWMEPQCFQIRSDKFKKQPLTAYTDKVAGWGSIGLPEWYANAFVENDGLESKRLNATMINIENMIYGETGVALIDDEFKYPKLKHAERVKSDKIGISSLAGHYGQSFWIPMKHVIRVGDAVEEGNSYSSVHRLNNIIVMRYAEVLLNYAECCLRTGDEGSAKTYINMIQNRAGSQTISDKVDLVTLKKEKSFELWFEGCRYQDLMRWSKIDSDSYTQEGINHLKAQGTHVPNLCDKLFRKDYKANEVTWQHSSDGSDAEDRFYITYTSPAKDAGFEVGWQEKHRLFPYPTSIIQNNPALHQNPGWE